ncbi:uncharacterized protein EI90DRAFT_2975491 [Cantharellus anzutake]|uniref:uncharacterized protein n=1 Tax=Cantharellus anzutake TaxID=1750568 RepID=UPI001904F723|nr:uncharacterized protein EI90DRAFT_2975491 [Cantharellus anzutake]KAF8326839.1 hypothetical protein EI90DRAFT_2975491 [Cantharellus anzutake]
MKKRPAPSRATSSNSDIPASPLSQFNFPRSGSPSGFGNFLSRPSKWFQRSNSGPKTVQDASAVPSATRRPIISQPTDVRPLLEVPKSSLSISHSYQDLSRSRVGNPGQPAPTTCGPVPFPGSPSNGSLLSYSRKSRSVDDLSQYASAPEPSTADKVKAYQNQSPARRSTAESRSTLPLGGKYTFPTILETPPVEEPEELTAITLPPLPSIRPRAQSQGAKLNSIPKPTNTAVPLPSTTVHKSVTPAATSNLVPILSNSNGPVPLPTPLSNGGTSALAPSTGRLSQIIYHSGFLALHASNHASLAKGWAPRKVVLKGTKLFLFKPPKDRASDIKALFPVGIVTEPQFLVNGDSNSGVSGTVLSPRKRVYWGRDKHPDLHLSSDRSTDRGTTDALVHECVFRTSFENAGEGGEYDAFLRAVMFCLPHRAFMGRPSFEAEFLRRISQLIDGAPDEGAVEAREHSMKLLELYESTWGGFEDDTGFKTWHAENSSIPFIPHVKGPGTPLQSPEEFPLPASPSPLPRSPGHPGVNDANAGRDPARMAAKARSQARLWGALEKEGLSADIFSRLDYEKVAYSLRVWANSKMQAERPGSLGPFFERSGDGGSRRVADLFSGSDAVPHWLTYTVLHHLLGSKASEGDVEGQTRALTFLSRTHTRADLLGRWIAVGENARLWGDQCTWTAIKTAVCCKAVARLEKVWKRVSHRERKCVENWVRGRSSTDVEANKLQVPWFGDRFEAVSQLLISITPDDINRSYLIPTLLEAEDQAKASFSAFREQMGACSRAVNDDLEGEAAALARFWDYLSARPPINPWQIDQFLELSYAAEPRQKSHFNPHFWAPPSATSIHPGLPLLFPEPLPCTGFLDRPSVSRLGKQENLERSRAMQPEELLGLLPEAHFRSVLGVVTDQTSLDTSRPNGGTHSLAPSNEHDVGNTFVAAFGGELILKVLPFMSVPNPQTSGSNTQTQQFLSATDVTSLKRKPSLAPSLRVAADSPRMSRQSSTRRERRSSLPSLSRASSVVIREKKVETPLRATVSAGTLDRLVDILVEGLEVSVTSTDDSGLSSGKFRPVIVDREDFSKSWWHTFRSFVTPMVFFELMLKRYSHYPGLGVQVESSSTVPLHNLQEEVLHVLKDWMEIGGGSSDVLDDPQLFRSFSEFTVRLTKESDAEGNQENKLNDARKILASIFSEQSRRPLLLEESAKPSHPQSQDAFGTLPPSIDDLKPEHLVANLDSIASAVMAAVTSDDLLVTSDILELQTADRLGWYPQKDLSTASDEVVISNIYSHMQLVQPSSLSADLSPQDVLHKNLPPSIRMVFRCQAVIRKWVIAKLTEPGISPRLREERMRSTLRAIEYCRLSVRSIEGNFASLNSSEHVAQQRKFIETALCSAILSPESRLFTRAWQNVAATRGGNLDSLSGLLSQGYVPARSHLRPLALDGGWIFERLLELVSLPDTMAGEHTLINFDKRRYISMLASCVSGMMSQNTYTDRAGIDRMNNMLKELAASERDHRLVKEDAQRESVQPSPSYIGRRNVRPFQSLIAAQVEKIRRDRHAKERLSKEKRQEQQRSDRLEGEMNRAMQPSKRPSLNLAPKHERGKRSMSALFRVVRPISAAFSDRAHLHAEIKRRRLSELDFQPIGKPSLVLSLADATSSIFTNEERPYTLELITEDGGRWLLQAISYMELVRWIDVINSASKKRHTYIGNGKPQLSEMVDDMARDLERVRHDAVFGVSLESLTSREVPTHADQEGVPAVLQKLLFEVEYRGLTEIGIYRISGGMGAINTIKRLFDEGFEPDLRNDDRFVDIHCVCGAVKLFLRQLPEPLIPFSLYSDAIASSRLIDYNERSRQIRELVHSLPRIHFLTLRRLIEHLDRVTDYEESNQMTAESLAICFSPSLLQPPPSPASFAIGVGNMGPAMAFTKGLILQFHRIFGDSDPDQEPEPEAEIGQDPLPDGTVGETADAVDHTGSHNSTSNVRDTEKSSPCSHDNTTDEADPQAF